MVALAVPEKAGRKIRVLHMPVTNSGSGVTRYVLENLRFIDGKRFIFDVATRSPRLDFADLIRDRGGMVHFLTYSSYEDGETFTREMRAILAHGYDAVHLHTSYWNGFLVERMAVDFGVPVIVVHAHSTGVDMVDPAGRRRALERHEHLKRRFSPDLATHFCACSRKAAEWLFGEHIPADRIRILNNAVDTESFRFAPGTRERLRREWGLTDRLVLGHAGRFSWQKNHLFLLDVLAEMLPGTPRARLLLAGDGELLEDVRRAATERGLADKAVFLGRRRDMAEVMQAMDAYLQPSRFEGLGLALVEAQAAGLPCFASGNVPEEARVTPNLFFLPDDPRAWARSVRESTEGFCRGDVSGIVEAAGYSLRRQIEFVEEIYMGKA